MYFVLSLTDFSGLLPSFIEAVGKKIDKAEDQKDPTQYCTRFKWYSSAVWKVLGLDDVSCTLLIFSGLGENFFNQNRPSYDDPQLHHVLDML